MPIDDELRELFTQRAGAVTAPPSVLPGVERRARRIRRNRQLAAGGSTMAAVVALALLVPALLAGGGPAPREVATPTPSVSANPSPSATAAAARPAVLGADWDRPELAREGLDEIVAESWARSHQVPRGAIAGEQLLLGASPDGALSVGAYHIWAGDGRAYEVVAQARATEGGGLTDLVIVTDEEVEGPPNLAVGVVSSASPYVVVAAARPGLSTLAYAADGTEFEDVALDSIAAVFERTGPTGAGPDTVRATFADGSSAFEEVPPALRGEDETAPPTEPRGDSSEAPLAAPANLVDWPVRGRASEGPDPAEVQEAVEKQLGPGARYRALFHYATDGGLRATMGQAWAPGKPAVSMLYTTGSECGAGIVLGPETPESPAALAYTPTCVPGNTFDTAIIVGTPRTGLISYGEEGSEFRPAPESPRAWDGVVEIELDAPVGTRWIIQILDGNGDLDNPLYEGPLDTLVCGTECS